MNVAFTGKIIAAEPVQQGTSQNGQPWQSQTFVIEELNQQYPSRAVFQVFGADRLQQFALQVGEIITAHIGTRANQSSKDGRWYGKLDCWKVDRPGMQQPTGAIYPSQVGMQQPQYPPQPQAVVQQTAAQYVGQDMGQQGNLPF